MGKKILLADDEPNIVLVVSKRLEMQGYQIISAGDGQQALEKARMEKPDLILLDLQLPKIDGYKVCQILKADESTKAIPIILFSARMQMTDKEAAQEYGANAYLAKPFQPEVLLLTLQKLLDHPA